MKLFVYILFFIPCVSLAQSNVGYVIEEMPNDSISHSNVKFHSNLRPFVRQKTQKIWTKNTSEKANQFSISPLADLNGSYLDSVGYRVGAGVSMELTSKKWYARIAGIGGIAEPNTVFNTNSYYAERKGKNEYYADVRGRISYTPNDVFNFQVGLDNHFIGEGSRSLFLSDYGDPFPFGQIRTRFWRVEYTVMYQFMREKLGAKYSSKNGATHHISLNAAKWLTIGVFESVMFRPKDTLLNRGYDVEYLNPIIFYRPQEYSLGSSDNVLLGLSLDGHWKQHTFYSQLIMDEFNLTEIRKKTKWWANKFGLQFGYKSRFKTKTGNWFVRTEYNYVRPYTYAHIDQFHNYGNQGSNLAHPLGSNFHELIGELKWQYKKWTAKVFLSYSLQGIASDTTTYNYGFNVYVPYNNRPSDYGIETAQGRGKNSFISIITLDYEVFQPMRLHAYFENQLRYSSLDSKIKYYPVVGLRSFLWNDYRNY